VRWWGRAATPLVVLILLALLAVPAAAQSESPAASAEAAADDELQPDIILVMVDDLAYIPDDRVLKRLPNISELWLDGGLRRRPHS